VLALGLGACAGQSVAPDLAAAQVLELDRAWGQAYVKGDADFVERLLAPDWVGWLDGERTDRATELTELRAGHRHSDWNSIDEPRIGVYGETAVLEARERVRYHDEDGERTVAWRITDVFVRRHGVWQVVATHESSIPAP
jgi:ketosteroid isomerase-like protein